MKYAVVEINKKQYKVKEKDELLVDKIEATKIDPKVLLLVDKGKALIGKPYLKNKKIKVKVLKEVEKGKKLTIDKYKAKSRYRKRIGFRPQYTRLLIEKI